MFRTPRVLGVEDDPAVRRLLTALLGGFGLAPTMTETGEAFLKALEPDPPDLFLLDLHLPDAFGLDLLKKASARHPGVPAIVVTGSEVVQDAVEAMRLGAVDYLVKPVESQRLQVSVRNALRMAEQQGEIARLRTDVQEGNAPEHLVGSSTAMEELRAMIRKIGAGDVPALILGETGTGKELVARAIHYCGPRRSGPFVEVNCAALTETLMESEIFGHEKGAFTGAQESRPGLFEQANGGSIFLDEIGEMPLTLQPKILRVLQENRFKRVGGDRTIEVNVRVICATNRDLQEAMKSGRFRQDLFYRVNGIAIEIPPLRDRLGDLSDLAAHFLRRACRKQDRPVPKISPATLALLRAHSWPGNVRELEHAVERAMLLCDGGDLLPKHCPPGLAREADAGRPIGTSLVEAVERLEDSLIREALQKNGWVRARAARALGITERMISYKMNSLGIRPPAVG